MINSVSNVKGKIKKYQNYFQSGSDIMEQVKIKRRFQAP